MNISEFYIQVLDSLNENGVDYMLVGGHAVNYHGYTRSTLDMDIWVDTVKENLERLESALVSLGYNVNSCKKAIEYLISNHIFKIPKDDALIEILDDKIIRQSFSDCYTKAEEVEIENVAIKVIGINDLINCKKKSNRAKDLLDVQELQSLMDLQKMQAKQSNLLDSEIKKPKKRK